MTIEKKVLACVDRSPLADHVTDYATWAAGRLPAPLELLHVLERHPERGSGDDRSGTIGVDAQEELLSRLSADDESQSKALREEGRVHLNRLRERALAAQAPMVDVRQRHGDLDDTVAELEAHARLVVMGRQTPLSAGTHFERTVRRLRKPILTVPGPFRPIERVMIAFDGRIASRHGVEMVAASPLFRQCQIYLLMSGEENAAAARQLEWARQTFLTAGVEVEAMLTPGSAAEVVPNAVQAAAIDLLVMGAYSHSPLRSLVRGSKTSDLLRSFSIPTLLMR
jgi:nucleotide-binding universal stress UspA family protein